MSAPSNPTPSIPSAQTTTDRAAAPTAQGATPSRARRLIRNAATAVLAASPLIGWAAYRARAYKISTSDFDDFHATISYGLFSGGPMSMPTEFGVFNYHPFFAVVMAPLGLFPMPVACVIFLTVSVVLLACAATLFADTVSGCGPGSSPTTRRLLPLATLLTLPFLANSIVLGQFEPLILALLLFAYVAYVRRWDAVVGALIAAATLLKAFPGLLLIWLIAKRRVRAILYSFVAIGIGMAVLPTLLFGPQENLALHQNWFERVVRGGSSMQALTAPDDTPKLLWQFNNESLPMVLRRVLTPLKYDDEGNLTNIVALPETAWVVGPVSVVPLQIIYVGVTGLIVLGMFWTIRHPAGRLSDRRLAHEFALVALLSVVLSPLVWGGRYFLLAWPAAYLLLASLPAPGDERARLNRTTPLAILTLAVWSVSLVLWKPDWLRAVGVHLWAAILLSIWVGWTALRIAPQAPSKPTAA